MLYSVIEDLKYCCHHAEECARRAASEKDPELRQDFLNLESYWLDLARSYELGERVSRFITTTLRLLSEHG
jgi:hypothetical protein